MVGRIFSTALLGIEAVSVEVQAQLSGAALKRFSLIGLPDNVLKEAKERVRCAIENSGFSFPSGEIVVSLAPADLPKSGSAYDLPIALSILLATGQLQSADLERALVLGELGLDGRLKPVRGALAAACFAKKSKLPKLILPAANVDESRLISGIESFGVGSLLDAVLFLNGEKTIPSAKCGTEIYNSESEALPDFSDVMGQASAKRAMEIVAAGGHNVLMIGPPGAGKTMLARRLPSILPVLSLDEQIEVTRVYSVLGDLSEPVPARTEVALIAKPPFRAPHHSTSMAGLIGGGSRPVPGEISLAHRGVLFLDEINEMRREALEALREPLETKTIVISRAKWRMSFPADFMLVGAMNPCPCGNRGSVSLSCSCSSQILKKYSTRLSGPIMDRIDLQIWLPPVSFSLLNSRVGEDSTPLMRSRVQQARARQSERHRKRNVLNARLSPGEVKKYCEIDQSAARILENAMERYRLSARAYSRVLKVARTIADLADTDNINNEAIAESLSYRVAFK